MKFAHMVTYFILATIVLTAITSIIAENWDELGMCITAFGGWFVVAGYERKERKLNETLSR